MIRVQISEKGGPPQISNQRDRYKAAIAEPSNLLWADFQGEPADTSLVILRDTFGFHPLAIDDAIAQTHNPKVDDWDHYLYIALHALNYEHEAADVEMIELDVFLGANYLVTHHDLPIPALDRTWEIFQNDARARSHGADHILYILLDELTNDFMHTVEELDLAIDEIEDQVFDNPNAKTVQNIFHLKRATLRLRRSLAPMREVLNKLARDEFNTIDGRDRIYFRDVYDHFVRLHDIAESLRDLVGGVLDTYLSVVNNRMNDVMKTLTLITTLFMPVSFLAGFFGMNFFQPVTTSLQNWTASPAFFFVMVLFLLIPALMYLWMRRRGWM